ncbi:MAG: 30S ribosomal protein S6 [Patescibacteria group bacterium]
MEKKYEVLFILPAKHTDDEVTKLTEKVVSIVIAAGGKVIEKHLLGKQKLAYPIQHSRYGHYVLVNFDAETPVVAKLNEMLRLSTDLLRHLIVTRDPKITKMPRLIDYDELKADREEEAAPRMAPPTVQAKPVQPKVEDKVIMAELDKKLDEILAEEVK